MTHEWIRVFIVDDSTLVRLALREMLESDPEIQVVGEAADGREALHKIQHIRPTIVTMDVRMPIMDGLETTERLMAYQPTPVLVITALYSRDDIDISFKMLGVGALEVMEKPDLSNVAAYERARSELIRRVKLLARVKVVTHLRGRRRAAIEEARKEAEEAEKAAEHSSHHEHTHEHTHEQEYGHASHSEAESVGDHHTCPPSSDRHDSNAHHHQGAHDADTCQQPSVFSSSHVRITRPKLVIPPSSSPTSRHHPHTPTSRDSLPLPPLYPPSRGGAIKYKTPSQVKKPPPPAKPPTSSSTSSSSTSSTTQRRRMIKGKFPLVVIGASTGGPRVVQQLLQALPQPFGAALVVVQHIAEGFSAGMVEWLAESCAFPVRLAKEHDLLEIDHVLVAPDSYHLFVQPNGRVHLSEQPMLQRPSVDITMKTAAEHFGSSVMGVLLTGMGRDGAVGMQCIRQAGGYTIAQDETSCSIYGMPRAAVELEAVDVILAPDQIIPSLCERLSTV